MHSDPCMCPGTLIVRLVRLLSGWYVVHSDPCMCPGALIVRMVSLLSGWYAAILIQILAPRRRSEKVGVGTQ